MPSFVFQPVDKCQAMVRRESVVNLENFKRQYARRRWKVQQQNFNTDDAMLAHLRDSGAGCLKNYIQYIHISVLQMSLKSFCTPS